MFVNLLCTMRHGGTVEEYTLCVMRNATAMWANVTTTKILHANVYTHQHLLGWHSHNALA